MPAREVLARVLLPVLLLVDASSCPMAVLGFDCAWNHSRSSFGSEMGMDFVDWIRVDRDRDFVEEEEILLLRRRRGWDAVLCH